MWSFILIIVVIDEVQKLPKILDEAHRLIEAEKLTFLLTGSSARKLKRGGADLLGGRVWWAEMFPLTSNEIPDLYLMTYLNRGGLPAGYPRIKMKIKPGTDVKRVEAMRKTYPDVPLMVDANNAYSLDDLDTLKALDGFNLIMIEQPLAYDDIMDHATLQPQLETPLCLDESIHGPYFARVAIEMKACRIINIKQGRVAGLARSKEVHDMCRQADIGVWCGGMFETGVGRAIQVALAGLPNFIYPNDISASARCYPRDIVDPEFALNADGTISVPDGNGLGVEVNSKVLDGYTIAREVIRI